MRRGRLLVPVRRRHGHRRTGPGKGGKYLFLPPGYDGDEPDGYFVYRTPTFTNWAVFRALGGVAAVEQTRVYRLADAADPPATSFVNVADKAFNTVHANDFSFFEEIDELVQEEPAESLDPERAGQLAAVGIRHGKSFAPDERLRGILDAAARTAAGISRALVYFPRDSGSYLHAGSSWKQAFVGGSYEFLHDHARLLDARTLFHYFATVITPAMAHAQVGAGSAYAYTAEDAEGAILDGGKTYRLTLPPNPPAKNFWSVDVYDTQTRSLLQTDNPYPSLMSLSGTVEPEDDGSFVLWFGPTPPTVGNRTGFAPSRTRVGSRCSGCTDRSSPGSTGRGYRANSRRPIRGAADLNGARVPTAPARSAGCENRCRR